MPSNSALALCLLLIALPAAAEVYTYIDAQGNRVFTDQPGSGNAKRVPMAASNRMSANPTGAAPMTTAKKLKPNRFFTTTCCAFWCPILMPPFATPKVS